MADKPKLAHVTPLHEKAPRPSRRSLAQILYDVIDAIGGDGATEAQILEYLPAAITDGKDAKLVLSPKRLHQNLIVNVHVGYFLHDPNRSLFRIATKQYYDARVAYNKDPERERRQRVEHEREAFSAPPEIIIRRDWITVVAAAVLAFVLGIIVGRLL